MSDQKNWRPFWLPPFDMDWDLSSYRKQWNEFKANVDRAWDEYQEMQKEAQKMWKEQWGAFFDQCIEMEKAFTEHLPDEKVSVPGMPVAPLSVKEAAEKAVEFQEKANERAVKQNDSLFDFHMKEQKRVKEMVTEAVKNAEERMATEKSSESAEEEPKEDAAEAVKEEKPEAKKASKPAAQSPKKAEAKADAENASKPAEEQK